MKFPDFLSSFFYTHKHTLDMSHSSGTKDRKFCSHGLEGKQNKTEHHKTEFWLFWANLPLQEKKIELVNWI